MLPIPRWEASLFPSLSAGLMAFTKLLRMNVCVFCRFVYKLRASIVHVYLGFVLACTNLMGISLYLSKPPPHQFDLNGHLVCNAGVFCCSTTSNHRGAAQQFAAALKEEGKWTKTGNKSAKPAHTKKLALNYV